MASSSRWDHADRDLATNKRAIDLALLPDPQHVVITGGRFVFTIMIRQGKICTKTQDGPCMAPREGGWTSTGLGCTIILMKLR